MIASSQGFTARYCDVRTGQSGELVSGKHFRLDAAQISQQLVTSLSPRMIDLLRVASVVYAVDRLVRRQRRGSTDWGRQLSCTVPVRDFQFWNSGDVRSLVEDSVQFVSGDSWQIKFSADLTSCDCQSIFDGFPADENPITCLYSGGLDSAAGLAARLQQGIAAPVIPVTVRHRTDLTATTTPQLKFLAEQLEAKLTPISVAMSMVSPQRLVDAEEASQRARSFLFVSVGGVVAWAAGSSSLELYESGLGAINAPLLAGMQGSQATRSTHPYFLRLMGKLLTLAAERPLSVTLPFWQMTKSEVVQSLTYGKLAELAVETISCVSYPLRHRVRKSCGVCPACIFRRVALVAAGIEEPSHRYQCDLLDRRSSLNPEKLQYLKAFLLQVDHLSEVDEHRLPPLISRHLRLTRVLEEDQTVETYLPLYRRYRHEWLSFIGKARSHDCEWTDLIDVGRQAA